MIKDTEQTPCTEEVGTLDASIQRGGDCIQLGSARPEVSDPWVGTDCSVPAPAQECVQSVHCTGTAASSEARRVGVKASKGKWCFVQQVLNVWSLLPEEVVGVKSLHGFRRKLDKSAEVQ